MFRAKRGISGWNSMFLRGIRGLLLLLVVDVDVIFCCFVVTPAVSVIIMLLLMFQQVISMSLFIYRLKAIVNCVHYIYMIIDKLQSKSGVHTHHRIMAILLF